MIRYFLIGVHFIRTNKIHTNIIASFAAKITACELEFFSCFSFRNNILKIRYKNERYVSGPYTFRLLNSGRTRICFRDMKRIRVVHICTVTKYYSVRPEIYSVDVYDSDVYFPDTYGPDFHAIPVLLHL